MNQFIKKHIKQVAEQECKKYGISARSLYLKLKKVVRKAQEDQKKVDYLRFV